MKPLLEIMKLNQTRYGSKFNITKFKKVFMEEVDEMFTALENNDIHEFLDGANDAIVVLAGGITQQGYNPELTLKHTVKEITCRKQLPEQAQRWSKDLKLQDTEKWLKDPKQDSSTLYLADYRTCKLQTAG